MAGTEIPTCPSSPRARRTMGINSIKACSKCDCVIQQRIRDSVCPLLSLVLFLLLIRCGKEECPYHGARIGGRELINSYTHQNTLVSLFYRWFQDQSSWALPILYVLLKDLRDLAEQVRYLSSSSSTFLHYILTELITREIMGDGQEESNGTRKKRWS